jgi:hypothetical protein
MSSHIRTEAQMQASRANGAKSNGPVTVEGKLQSSLNGFKNGSHAVFSGVLRGEDPTAYRSALAALVECHQPANLHEQMLVERIALADWRLNRLAQVQLRALEVEMDRVERCGAGSLDRLTSAIGALAKRTRLLQYLDQAERTIYLELRWLHAELRRAKRDSGRHRPAVENSTQPIDNKPFEVVQSAKNEPKPARPAGRSPGR